MLAGTTFQEVLVLLGVTMNMCDTHKRSLLLLLLLLFQTTIDFMGQPFPPPEST